MNNLQNEIYEELRAEVKHEMLTNGHSFERALHYAVETIAHYCTEQAHEMACHVEMDGAQSTLETAREA